MKWVDFLHRWAGGSIGLLLALLGLTGAILIHRDAWVGLPHMSDPQIQSTAAIAAVTQRLMTDPATRPRNILFATPDFGLDRLSFAGDAGAYVDQNGAPVATWSSEWARPEIWLFDLHHHLLSGETGETIVGLAGIAGFCFVITGTILWWRTRKTFEFRLWPKRLSRPAILRYHRDLGILLAPLLLLSLVTGVSMVFRPVTALFLGPSAPAAIDRALKAPPSSGGKIADRLDWSAMIATARAHYPDAEIRSISLPKDGKGLIALRLRQPQEWAPNGRTTIWFAPDTGRFVADRNPATMPLAVRAYNLLYPLHAAAVGGLAYRLLMTLSGLALGVLGSLTVWTFWFRRPAPRRR